MTVHLPELPARTPRRWYFVASWHQAMYNAAAHRVHWALGRDTDDDSDAKAKRTALEDANRLARRLLLVSTQALIAFETDAAEFERFVPKVERAALKVFLDQTVGGIRRRAPRGNPARARCDV